MAAAEKDLEALQAEKEKTARGSSGGMTMLKIGGSILSGGAYGEEGFNGQWKALRDRSYL